MANCTLNVSLISLHLLLFSLFTCSPTAVSSSNSTMTPLDGESPFCALINCGQGKCISDRSHLGVDCECNPGWKKMQLGPLTFPSCIVPNCTINFDCGNGGPATPPPFSFLQPSLSISDPCSLVWCGEGTCISNGNGHTCQCNEGSANLFNKTDLACVRQCFLGADCDNLGLELGPPPPPPAAPSPPSSSASPSTPGPTGNAENSNVVGTTGATNSSNKLRALAMTLLAATFFSWL